MTSNNLRATAPMFAPSRSNSSNNSERASTTSRSLRATAPVFAPSGANSSNNSERASTSSNLRATASVFIPSRSNSSNNSERSMMSSGPLIVTSATYIPFDSNSSNNSVGNTPQWGVYSPEYEFTNKFQGMQLEESPVMAGSASDMDIRAYPQPRRAVFAQGQPVLVVLGEVTLIELPFPLFMAASTKPELLVNGIIQLPGHIKHYAVVHLVCYLNEMVLSPQEFPRLVTHGMNVWNMLDINKAAEALGVAEYVDHAYRKCEAYLRRELPEYEELDACTYHAQGDDLNYTRLLRIVAENLAVRMWEDTIPDSEQFHRYLEYNVPLGQQIQLFIQQREAYFAHIEELKEQRMPQPQRANYNHKRREQGDWRPTVANEPTQEDLQWKKEKAQKAAKSKAFWDIKKAQNAEDAKAIQEKLTLSGNKRKFTAREQKYYRELHGTHKLPKGC